MNYKFYLKNQNTKVVKKLMTESSVTSITFLFRTKEVDSTNFTRFFLNIFAYKSVLKNNKN